MCRVLCGDRMPHCAVGRSSLAKLNHLHTLPAPDFRAIVVEESVLRLEVCRSYFAVHACTTTDYPSNRTCEHSKHRCMPKRCTLQALTLGSM